MFFIFLLITQNQHINNTDSTQIYHKLTLPIQSESVILCTMRIFLISKGIRFHLEEIGFLFAWKGWRNDDWFTYCAKNIDYVTNIDKSRQANLIKSK